MIVRIGNGLADTYPLIRFLSDTSMASYFHLPPSARSHLLWAGGALTLGLLIAGLPIQYSGPLIVGAVVVGLSLWRPVFGLGCALLLGPTRAFLAAAGYASLLFDLGQIFFALALGSWLLRSAAERALMLPRLWLLFPLSLYVFVGLLSLLGALDWRDGFNEIIKWLEVILTLLIAFDEAQRGRLNWLLAAVLLTGLAQAGIGLWQYQLRGTGPDSFRLSEGVYRAYGSFEQPNPFGGFLGLIWPISAGLAIEGFRNLGRKKQTGDLPLSTFYLPLLLISAVILLALYASFSRGAWLGAAAAGLVMAMFFPRRLSLGLGLGMVGLAGGWVLISAGLLPASIAARFASLAEVANFSDVRGVNTNDANFAIVERLAHWQAALDMARAHPWLGVGLGNYGAAYSQYALFNWPLSLGHAHNIYLNALAETGVFGLLAYLFIWVTTIGLTIRTLRRATGWQRGLALGLLGVWAHLLAHQVVDNLHVNNIDLLIATQLGLLCALNMVGRRRTLRTYTEEMYNGRKS